MAAVATGCPPQIPQRNRPRGIAATTWTLRSRLWLRMIVCGRAQDQGESNVVGNRSRAIRRLQRLGATLLTVVAVAGCSQSASTENTAASGGVGAGLPDTLAGPSVKSDTISVKSLDGIGGTGSDTSRGHDGSAGTDGAHGPDNEALADITTAGADAAAPDAAPPGDSSGPLEDGGATDDDAGATDEDAGSDPDSEWPVPDVVKDAGPDNGEDPTKPWYSNPLPDQYTYADTPDSKDGASSDVGAQAFPPVCTPQIGSVSVTESIGAGGKIDIVVWIDTSGSMSQEAAWTNQNINKFTQYLETKGLDYRLVLYGTGLGLCVGPPLGTGPAACNSAQPQKFLTVKNMVASTNGLTLLMTQKNFDLYKLFLRPDAAHNIIGITDDNSSTAAATFKTNYGNMLLAVGLQDKFVYHAICSFVNEANPNQAGNCSTGAAYGLQHVSLAQSTGGTLYQVCKNDWTAIFDGLSKAVAATAKPVCTYKLPAPVSKKWNPQNVKVSHIESGVVVQLNHIAAESQCAASPNGWYYDNDLVPTTVTLCNEQCKKLVGGAVVFNFGCAL